jgi:hypothetical protein
MGCEERTMMIGQTVSPRVFTGHCFPPGGLVVQARIACQRTPLVKKAAS